MKIRHFSAAALLGLMAATVQAQPVIKGGVLADTSGRTLYVFDKDEPGASSCKGACLQAWPTYSATPAPNARLHAQAGRLPSGQWTWNNRPLYHFAGDAQPGDKAGDGNGGVWHVVNPSVRAGAAPVETSYKY